jgi:hypothetical protein
MDQLQKSPVLSAVDSQTPLCGDVTMEWSCPACGLFGTVDALGDVDSGSVAIKSHHALVSPSCLNSLYVVDPVN